VSVADAVDALARVDPAACGEWLARAARDALSDPRVIHAAHAAAWNPGLVRHPTAGPWVDRVLASGDPALTAAVVQAGVGSPGWASAPREIADPFWAALYARIRGVGGPDPAAAARTLPERLLAAAAGGEFAAADLLSRASFGGLPVPLDPRGVRAVIGPAGVDAHAGRYAPALARGWPHPHATTLLRRPPEPALARELAARVAAAVRDRPSAPVADAVVAAARAVGGLPGESDGWLADLADSVDRGAWLPVDAAELIASRLDPD
jgi:hypothetical protein